MRCRFTKTAVLICATLVTLNSVTAADEFKNSVVNMKIDKDGNNIKVTVVTDKPYTSPLVVNPKENNNYVILLPETKNVMKSNPNIDKVSDTVNGFSIKTQPYNSSCYKGYTKILISTSKPTNISTTTKLNSQYKESTLAEKKPTQEVQKKVSKAMPALTFTPPKKNYYQNYVVKRPSKHRRLFVVRKSKPIIAQHVYKPIVAKPVVKPQVKPVAVKPIVVKKVQNPVQNIAKPKNISKPVAVKKTEAPLLVKEQKAMDNEIKTRDEISKEIQQSDKTKQESKISIGEKIKSAMSNLLHIKSGLIKSLLILSAVGFPIAVIFYIILINNKLRAKSVRETQYYTKPEEEKVDDEIQQDEEMPIEPDTTEEEFDTEEHLETTQHDIPSDSPADEITEDEIEESFKEFSNQEELEEDNNLLQEEKSILEEAETSFNAMLEDAEAEDDLVEDIEEEEKIESDVEEEIVSDIDNEEGETTEEEDIFADSEIEEEIQEEFASEVDEDIDFSEDNLEDIEISEDDESDEVESGEEEGDPSEIVEDEIDETSVELEEFEEFEESQEEQEPEEPIEIYEPDGFINDFEPIVPDDSIFDELIPQPLVFDETIEEEALALGDDEKDLEKDNDDIFEELREEYQIIDGMKVLTNAKIDESRGFYLVDYDNVSSLVGYVDDDIFVIKTFDDFVDNQIYVKLADKISETVNRYIVKVGLFKIVVEVTNTGMSHIIDL